MAARDGHEPDTIPDCTPEADALEIGDPHDGLVVLSLTKDDKTIARLVLERDELRELAVHLYSAFQLLDDDDDAPEEPKPDDTRGRADAVAGHA